MVRVLNLTASSEYSSLITADGAVMFPPPDTLTARLFITLPQTHFRPGRFQRLSCPAKLFPLPCGEE